MLKDTFKERSIQALRAKDTDTRRIMNNILSRLLEVEKSEGFQGWTESLEQETIRGYIKSLQKAVEQLKGAPVVEGYVREIAMLETFLPGKLNEEQTRELVQPYAANAKSIGQFMGAVMKDHREKVDPGLVRKVGLELGLS